MERSSVEGGPVGGGTLAGLSRVGGGEEGLGRGGEGDLPPGHLWGTVLSAPWHVGVESPREGS